MILKHRMQELRAGWRRLWRLKSWRRRGRLLSVY
jgi:hypothetical protein